ncbi:hypothetical protein AAC03nite_20490 [Alicyclobacillus acidoterrestris]|nr:hypothetical protein AAC03nite_20490 [Alicyclobacillus acidoterrestris]
MPKGDYSQLKADIEDGTVPIAHLLLEATAMSKLNGVAKGLLMFIWRRTYGWVEDGKRKFKDDRITLAEFAQATNSAKTYVSTQLKLLVKASVIIERPDPDNARYKRYGMNTEVSEWSSAVLDVGELQEAIASKLYLHSSRSATLTVKQKLNGLANVEGSAKAKRFSKTLTKRFSKCLTLTRENPSNGAVRWLSKESIEINKRSSTTDLNNMQRELQQVGMQLYPMTFGISQGLAYDLAELTKRNQLDIELAREALEVAKRIGKDAKFAKFKLTQWIQSGIKDLESAKRYESEVFGARIQASAARESSGPRAPNGLPEHIRRAMEEDMRGAERVNRSRSADQRFTHSTT